MSLREQKLDFIDKKSQYVEFEIQTGYIRDSDLTLFQLNKGENLYNLFYFLIGYEEVVKQKTFEKPLFLPCVEIQNPELGFYDVYLYEKEKDVAVCYVIDFTLHYKNMRGLQQQRNEHFLRGEILEIQRRNSELEKQLLEVKNEELKNLQKFKREFYSKIVHDIKTPLNNILALTPETGTHNNAFQYSIEYLNTLLEDLLDHESIEENRLQLTNKPFYLNQLLEDVSYAFTVKKRQNKSVNLKTDFQLGSVDQLEGDVFRLGRILFNLINNAFKYTNEGEVYFQVKCTEIDTENVLVSFSVKDTGIGISEENIATIIEPFSRIKNEATIEKVGHGLGLSIVKQLVDLMKGKLAIESNIGKGTNFFVHIPMKRNYGLQKKVEQKKTTLEGMRVLVIEDDPITRSVLEKKMKEFSDVETCKDTVFAKEKLDNTNYDFIFSDHKLGHDLMCEFLKTIDKYPPIIIHSGISETEFKSLYEEMGHVHYLNKPLDLIVFDKLLSKIIDYNRKEFRLDYLWSITSKNEELIKEIMDVALEDIPQLISELNKALENENLEKCMNVAHRLKTSFRYFSTETLFKLVEEIETIASSAKPRIDNMEESMKQVKMHLPHFFYRLQHHRKER